MLWSLNFFLLGLCCLFAKRQWGAWTWGETEGRGGEDSGGTQLDRAASQVCAGHFTCEVNQAEECAAPQGGRNREERGGG